MLKAKQARFCEEYVIDKNATAAAKRAEYSEKTAYSQGQRLLKKVEVQQRIASLLEAATKRAELTLDAVVAEYRKVAFSNVADLYDNEGHLQEIHKLPRDVAAAISSVEVDVKNSLDGGESSIVKIKKHDKIRALEALGKHLGMFPNRVELTGKEGGAIEITDVSNRELALKLALALQHGLNDTSDKENPQ